MEKHSIELIVRALNDHQVRYLIAGGLAVVAHGYVRFTADIDLLLAMDRRNLADAIDALTKLNYRPRAPVAFEQFADSDRRQEWMDQKGMTVFSLFSPDHPVTEIGLFVDPPLVFEEAYSRAVHLEVALGISATFCSIDDLIDLKSKAGPPTRPRRHFTAYKDKRQPPMNSSKISEPDPINQWESGWREHEQLQLQRLAGLSLAAKLAWLEDAHRIVLHLESVRSHPENTED